MKQNNRFFAAVGSDGHIYFGSAASSMETCRAKSGMNSVREFEAVPVKKTKDKKA